MRQKQNFAIRMMKLSNQKFLYTSLPARMCILNASGDFVTDLFGFFIKGNKREFEKYLESKTSVSPWQLFVHGE